jgi:hypothetical protein
VGVPIPVREAAIPDGGATYLAILPPTAHCWGVGGVYQNIVYERGSGPSGLTGACIDND